MLTDEELIDEGHANMSKQDKRAILAALSDGDINEAGRIYGKCMHWVVEQREADRADQLDADRAVDAQIDRRLARVG